MNNKTPFDDGYWLFKHEIVSLCCERNISVAPEVLRNYVAVNQRLFEELIRTRQQLTVARAAAETRPLPFTEPNLA